MATDEICQESGKLLLACALDDTQHTHLSCSSKANLLCLRLQPTRLTSPCISQVSATFQTQSSNQPQGKIKSLGCAKGRHQSHITYQESGDQGHPAESTAAIPLLKHARVVLSPQRCLPRSFTVTRQGASPLPSAGLPDAWRAEAVGRRQQIRHPASLRFPQMSSEMRCNSSLSPAPSITGAEY